MRVLNMIVLALVIIGALNWGLFAFGVNLIPLIFGNVMMAKQIVYIVIALCGLWAISFFTMFPEEKKKVTPKK